MGNMRGRSQSTVHFRERLYTNIITKALLSAIVYPEELLTDLLELVSKVKKH